MGYHDAMINKGLLKTTSVCKNAVLLGLNAALAQLADGGATPAAGPI